ncbi:MAG: hypothetical protein ACE5HI_20605 [bacterium]
MLKLGSYSLNTTRAKLKLVLDTKEYRELFSVLDLHQYREWQEIVEDYLLTIRKRLNNSWALYKIQESLASDVIKAQDYQKLCDEETDTIRKAISRLAKEKKIEELKEKNQEINDWARTKKFSQLIRKTVRNLGDCIAWKLLDYNRAWIGVLGDKEPVGKIEASESLLHELNELYNHTVTYNNLALLNDLTNVIRVSDLVVKNRNGKYALQEVKSSGNQNRRTKSQETTRKNITRFFMTGKMSDENGNWEIINFTVPFKTYFDELNDVFGKAEKDGLASRYLEDFLQVEVFIPDRLPKNVTEKYFEDVSLPSHPKWSKEHRVLTFDTFSELKLDFRHHVPPGLFPLPVELCAKLMTGYAVIFSSLNLDILAEHLTLNNWHVQIANKEDEIKDFAYKLSRGMFTQTFSPKLIGCLALQFMHKETILSMLEDMYQSKPKQENTKYLFFFEDEKNAYV